MSAAYANQQQAGFKNHVENIAIVGAGGRSGKFIAQALVDGGKHKVTAITRPDSTNEMLSGLHEIKHVNYDSRFSVVEALRGQDVLIITMAVTAPPESQTRLIDAAVEAGVKWIMPNEWGGDHTNGDAAKDTMIGERLIGIREYIKKVVAGKTHLIGMCCGFWYEFSLAGTEIRFGFDFDKKEVTFYDEGETRMNTSTWAQVGRGVASLLSLKVLPEDENDKGPYLSQYNDGTVYISSFFVNQKDMFESVLRVTGDTKEDWKISYEDVKKRYARGVSMMKEGNLAGFGMLLYARMFYKDGVGDWRARLDNDVLGLPNEDLDEATKVAIKMAREGETNAIHGDAKYAGVREN